MAHNNAIDQFTSNLCMFSSQDNQKCKLCFTESEILELKKKKKGNKKEEKRERTTHPDRHGGGRKGSHSSLY